MTAYLSPLVCICGATNGTVVSHFRNYTIEQAPAGWWTCPQLDLYACSARCMEDTLDRFIEGSLPDPDPPEVVAAMEEARRILEKTKP